MTIDAAAVCGWLGDHSLRVAVLIVLVGGASLVMRRASSHGRLFAWTVVLHLAVAMPLLAIALPDVPLPSVFAEPVILVPVASGASPDAATPPDLKVRPPKSTPVATEEHAGRGRPAFRRPGLQTRRHGRT